MRVILSTIMYAKSICISPTVVRPSAKRTGGDDAVGCAAEEDGTDVGHDSDDSTATSSADRKTRAKVANGVFWTEGPILNSMAVDTTRIETAIAEASWTLYMIFMTPGLFVLSWYYFDWPGIFCMSIYVVTYLFIISMSNLVHRYRRGINKPLEQRANLINDMLKGVRFIKMFAWEPVFLKRFHAVRRLETDRLAGVLTSIVAVLCIMLILPCVGQLIATLLHTWYVSNLANSANVIALQLLYFQAITVFSKVKSTISIVTIGWASVRNVEDFLLAEEYDCDDAIQPVEEGDENIAYKIQDATFLWLGLLVKREEAVNESPRPSILFSVVSVNLTIACSELVAIVRPLACGKTSLINGLVGQIARTEGEVRGPKPSTVAMYAQAPWI